MRARPGQIHRVRGPVGTCEIWSWLWVACGLYGRGGRLRVRAQPGQVQTVRTPVTHLRHLCSCPGLQVSFAAVEGGFACALDLVKCNCCARTARLIDTHASEALSPATTLVT